MDIDKLTIGEVKSLLALVGGAGKTHSIPIGEAVFIRTVTHHFTGRVKAVTDSDIVLADAAWIADDGRFSTALKTGVLNEIEPYPDGVIVGRDGVIDISLWKHDLPRGQK